MFVFLGDSILARLHDDVFKAVLEKECYLKVTKNGISLCDLLKILVKDSFALATNALLQSNTGTIHFIIAIGTNNMMTNPSVLSLENLHKALLPIMGSCSRIAATARLCFVSLASKACKLHEQEVALESIEDTGGRKKRKRESGSGRCHACSRHEYNNSFNWLLRTLAAKCNFVYLESPANDGKSWHWKDLTHLDESEHLKFLQELMKDI